MPDRRKMSARNSTGIASQTMNDERTTVIVINIASANHPYLQSRTELRRARLTTSG